MNSGSDRSVTARTNRKRRQPVEVTHVQQIFSHGRSKKVVVEVKRPRTGAGSASAKIVVKPEKKPQLTTFASAKRTSSVNSTGPRSETVSKAPRPPAGGLILRPLTDKELKARNSVLSEAKEREDRERLEAQERARKAEEEEEQRKRDAAEAQRKKDDERALREKEDAERRRAEAEAQRRLDEAGETDPRSREKSEPRDDDRTPVRGRRGDPSSARTPPRRRSGEQRGRSGGKLTLSNALADEERRRSSAALRRQQERGRSRNAEPAPAKKISREVVIPERITIQELAVRMAERAVDVIKILMQQGTMAKITDVIDSDTAHLIAEELGHTVRRVAESDVEDILDSLGGEDSELHPRAPVLTVMGHVDHGKTSLLDVLRKSNIAAKESGGITQHIGAYQVTVPDGGLVTFLDTPGHAAFAAMRARGAKLTDIVILVVAADDGVMPQTEEAIRHARAAKVPIIVAINKIDKPGADADRVRQDLLRHEVVTEEMGGEVLSVAVSAKTGEGLDKLLEAVSLQAELMELKAALDCPAAGIVLEACMEHGRGHMATLLVQRGRLHVGDIFVAGMQWGRVRALMNDQGKTIREAGPSIPIEVMGLHGTPEAGDIFTVLPTEVQAREIVAYRRRKQNDSRTGGGIHGGNALEDLMDRDRKARTEELAVLIKADVHGSAEAISQLLETLKAEEVKTRVIYSGVGDIRESDIDLAATSKAIILGFNVRTGAQARVAAERMGVEIRRYTVIYDLVDDVRAALSGMLAPQLEERRLGEGKVLEIFDISKTGKVAGCRIEDGQFRRSARVRLVREGASVYEGSLSSLRRFKDEVREVVAGQECGMAFDNFQDFRQDDVVECFEIEEIVREFA